MADVVAEWEAAPEEGMSFDDSDRFEEDSMCSWMSEPESLCKNWRGWQTQLSISGNSGISGNEKTLSSLRSQCKKGEVQSLIELSAQTVALLLPFEQVEKYPVPIPENLQLRIAFWSFPESEEDIRLYSCLANGNADEFQKGEHLVRNNCIVDIMQIGFHLSATVQLPQTSINKGWCLVAVTFDRQRITSCACNCDSNAKWCSHVVALCLARIQQPDTVCLRAPVSESLSRLQRDQLQKFAQYLISELPQQILPTAQRLLDDLLSSSSTAINEEQGAPDPTAGPSLSDISIWCLDEAALSDNIKKTLVKFCGPTPIVYSDVNSLYLSSTEPPAASEYSSLLRPLRGREPEGIWNLLSIVREMLRRRDCNAILLLDVVTEQCLAFEQVAVWWYNTCTSAAHLHSGGGSHSSHRPANNINSEIAQHAAATLCDEIVSLWRLVLLNPSLQRSRKEELKVRLRQFHDKTLNIIKRGKYKENHLVLFPGFKEAIKTCDFDWDGGSCINMCRHIICTCGNSTSPIHSDNELSSGVVMSPKKCFITKTDQETVMTVYRQELDYLFSRAESLYVHGYTTKACEMAVKLANELLNNPENLVNETAANPTSNRSWIRACTEYAFKTFDRVVFLCNVLSEHPAHRLLAFQIGLYGLEFERLPASSKAMEVKLFHKQLQLTNIMKKLPLGPDEISILREKAQCLIAYEENYNGFANRSSVQHVLPLHLTMFVFDALCQPNRVSSNKDKKFRETNSDSTHETEISKEDQELGFLASVTALGYKLNVSEAEHPLLCEGTRRQKGELALLLLVSYKNVHSKIKMILDKLLDKTLAPNLQAKSAFTGDSFTSSYYNHNTSSYLYSRKPKAPVTTTPATPVVPVANSPVNLPKPMTDLISPGPPSKYCTVCQTSVVHRHNYRVANDSNSSAQADDSSEEDDSRSQPASSKDDTDSTMSSMLHKQLRVDSGNEDIKSSSCDEEYPTNVCSPQRRDGKQSWRSPTVRPKRRQHCITNVNSSASEEAMLSDTSPRLTRRHAAHLPLVPSSGSGASTASNKPTTSSSTWMSRYPPSPSSDSSSNHSIKSDDSESNDLSDKPGPSGQSSIAHVPASSSPQQYQQMVGQHTTTVVGSGGKSRPGNNFRMKNRGRNAVVVPDVPNQPSEASAHFYFELAKTVLVKAGGNSSTSLFMQPQNSSQGGVNRNLLLAAFEIGLYALGMHNCVSPNWLSRTYSSHVSWITGQAMEIGSAALQILVDSWEGHLTPTETISLADRASHGRDPTTVQVAAELALSVLPHAHAVNPNEVQRALLQCREQGTEMLEKANIAVEQAGRGGGVYPEVLFEVARKWQWLHEKTHNRESRNPSPPQYVVPTSVAGNMQQQPQPYPSIQVPTGGPSMAVPVTGMVLHPTSVVTFQSDNGVRPHQPVGVTVHSPGIHQPVTLIHQPVTQTPLLHPAAFSPSAAIVTQSAIPSRSPHPVLDPQYTLPRGNGHHVVPPHILPNGAATMGHQHHTYTPASIHHHATGINLVPVQHSNRLHTLQYCAASGAYLAEGPHTHHHHTGHQSLQLATAIAPIPANALPLHNHPTSYQLQSAFRVSMLALDLLAKRTEDRPNSKYVKNPPYTNNVKWLLKLSIELGMHYVQQFCLAVVTGISSPFVLQDIAVETAQYLAQNNHQQACSNLRLPFLQPIVQKCLQMYIHFIHNRLYHLHPADYDDFASLVQNSRTAFCMTPGGLMQFNEVLQSIRRAKSCKKELWQKIVAGLAMPPSTV
uniref:zinc finger SWIM domain-containing protein 8-like isoform X1 n=1 Tax=Styela clava TaxID=7725 RepID=UPI00193A5545|nr:zinc finger SWIM domain-containing protein 8-like isoform X1 [Styela clava]